jgi:hypothetical protein
MGKSSSDQSKRNSMPMPSAMQFLAAVSTNDGLATSDVRVEGHEAVRDL